MRISLLVGVMIALTSLGANAQPATETSYTLPQDIRWVPDTEKPPGAFYAILRPERRGCGGLRIQKFAGGYEFPMHVNNAYLIFTIIKGTLVLGFDEHHLRAAERQLPAGSVVQGLVTEPHYGRAVGETVFEVFGPICEPGKAPEP